MADNRVQVDLVAENSDLRAKLAQAEAQIDRFGQGSQGATQRAADGFQEMTRSAQLFGKAIRFLAFPAIIWESAKRVSTWLQDAIDKTRTYKEEIKQVSEAFLEQSRAAQIATQQGPRGTERAKQASDEVKTVQKLQEELERARASEASARKRAFREVEDARIDDAGVVRQMIDDRMKAIDREEGARTRAAENELKRVTEQGRKAREAADDAAKRPVERRIADQRIQLAANNPELKAKLELEQAKKDIELQFKGETNAALLAMQAELLKNVEELNRRSLEKIQAEQRRQLSEMVAEARRAQEQGFGLSAGAPAFAGTGTALQFLQDNIASFARTASGGR